MRSDAVPAQPARLGKSEWGFLWILTLVNVLNYLDRNVINILVEPMREELGLADWQLGALTGLSFALLYTLAGIPMARVAERTHRPTILAIGVWIWSLSTMACGAAGSFIQLALARGGVGIGEAFGTATSHALVIDRMPRERRATGMAIFSTGMSIGGLLGMAVGGLVADRFGWQMAFYVAGAPGLLLGFVLLLTLRDGRNRTAMAKQPPFSFRDEAARWRVFLKQLSAKRSFPLIALGTASGGLVGHVHSAFFAAFFLRTHRPQLEQLSSQLSAGIGTEIGAIGFLGLVLGLSAGVMGVAGTLAGGYLTDRLARRDVGVFMMIPVYAKFFSIPLSVAALLVADAPTALILVAAMQLARSVSNGPALSSIHALVKPESRPTLAAMFIFVITIVAVGLGPVAVGLLSDGLSSSGLGAVDGLRVALLATELIGVVGAICFLLARPMFVKEAEY